MFEGKCRDCGSYGDNYHAGHLLPKGKYRAVEFDPANCHLQCPKCNATQSTGRATESFYKYARKTY